MATKRILPNGMRVVERYPVALRQLQHLLPAEGDALPADMPFNAFGR
jgi:hypothetical protein